MLDGLVSSAGVICDDDGFLGCCMLTSSGKTGFKALLTSGLPLVPKGPVAILPCLRYPKIAPTQRPIIVKGFLQFPPCFFFFSLKYSADTCTWLLISGDFAFPAAYWHTLQFNCTNQYWPGDRKNWMKRRYDISKTVGSWEQSKNKEKRPLWEQNVL